MSQLKNSLFFPRPGTLANLFAKGGGGIGIFEEISTKENKYFDEFIGNCENILILKMKI